MKIRCLLVDDEPPALAVLRSHIEAVPMLEVTGQCHNAIAAFDALQKHPVDLMFLDIKMPQLLGTDFLKSLRNPPKVILTTAYREYALEAFDLDVVDYLLKPISLDRFLRAVQKVIKSDAPLAPAITNHSEPAHTSSERFLYFRVDRKMVKVMVDDILYIESLKDYVRIVTASKQLVAKQTITSLEEMLPEEQFLRIHRSFIVSLKKIDSYSPAHIDIMGKELPIGRHYKNETERALKFGKS
ncbi:LytTR family DNA-binding domain-containing protein [Pontibacter sp. SGAir0037]|uniref:LytR/AlgR family response regulator transcription factor n=1 Tax=Pontibacter sp. SGAir0037 TaxID=2571030 RepID=UPI0010CCBF11|nr:LytTR family DNA-binding domain-containing protein [Pontibacter sp. SGAir0037]QCR23378.1 DNA-binding response regulator [Pontibacter sp. SGAir0037]